MPYSYRICYVVIEYAIKLWNMPCNYRIYYIVIEYVI